MTQPDSPGSTGSADSAGSAGSAGSPATSSPVAAPPPGRYQMDPARTTIRADVRAMFGLFTVHGRFLLRSGEVQIAEDPGQSSVQAAIDAASFESGLAARDTDVVSEALLDASAYPDITFSGGGPRLDGEHWVLLGTVTAHGVTEPVELRFTVEHAGDRLAQFRAVAQLDRTRFGVTKKKGMVGRTVHLAIEATCVSA